MANSNTIPKYLYVLLNNDVRMSGSYGKIFFDRKTARTWKQKATKSSKVNGSVAIARVPVGNDWEFVR